MSLKITKDRDRISRVHTGMARCSMNRTLLTIFDNIIKIIVQIHNESFIKKCF